MKPFPISEEKESELRLRMESLGVQESDLEEQFVRSGGHGGQNVNKTSTCVQLTHKPSGLRVKCQTTRQQGLNRFLARHRLFDKLEAANRKAAEEKKALLEKNRRRNRKRSPGVKENILKDKHLKSEKKLRRRPIRIDD